MISFALFCLTVFSCDATEPGDNKVELNPKLHSAFYWGYSGPGEQTPNVGQSVGPPILNTTWTHANIITFTTSFLDENDILRKGIFEIEINPDDYSLVDNKYHIYEYGNNILDMNYNNSTDEFLLLVYKDGNSEALTAKLEGDHVIEKEVLVDNSWSVEGIQIWNKEDGFIFYGRNPQTGVVGFYSLVKDLNDTYQKELIYAIEDQGLDRQNFTTSYDGKTLFFGLNESELNSNSGTMQLLKLSLTQESAIPEVIFERKGGYVYVAQNPVNQGLFLVNYFFGGNLSVEPQGHIELFNSVTSESLDLNVRTITSKYYFITNNHPSWSPNGKHFTFSGGGFSGEGDTYYPDLWIYENVP